MIIVIYSILISMLWFDFMTVVSQFKSVEQQFVESDILSMAANLHIKNVLLMRYALMLMVGLIIYSYTNNLLLMMIGFVSSYFLYYQYIKKRHLKLLKKTNVMFPYYLNNLAILIQQNPVANAIYKSIDYAPEIFKADLYQLVKAIHQDAESIEPYLNFAMKYQVIDDINRIMRSLYNLSCNVENKEEMIVSLSKLCNEKLSIQFKEDLKAKLDRQSILPYILFIWLGIIMVQMIATIQLF